MEPGIDGVGPEYLARTFETLLVAQEGPVVTVTMNRPEVRNAFNPAMIQEITDVMGLIGKTPVARVVVLTGSGETFSAGADINYMREVGSYSFEENVADAKRLFDMYTAIQMCPQPVVARVQGAALGGGTGLAAAADVVVASDSALFGFTEARLGIIPAVISPFVLSKVPLAQARELFLKGKPFDAKKAQEILLVSKVVKVTELDEAVAIEVDEFLQASSDGQARIKTTLLPFLVGRPDFKDIVAQLSAEARASVAGQAGLGYFLANKRKTPDWRTFDPTVQES